MKNDFIYTSSEFEVNDKESAYELPIERGSPSVSFGFL